MAAEDLNSIVKEGVWTSVLWGINYLKLIEEGETE